jgi:hypothetical protein
VTLTKEAASGVIPNAAEYLRKLRRYVKSSSQLCYRETSLDRLGTWGRALLPCTSVFHSLSVRESETQRLRAKDVEPATHGAVKLLNHTQSVGVMHNGRLNSEYPILG